MEPINYSWDSEDNTLHEEESFINGTETAEDEKPILQTRQNLQYARRLFHMGNGVTIATLYWMSFSHSQMVHALGTIACVLYVFEQLRINYPEAQAKFLPMTRFIIRAEEQLKEERKEEKFAAEESAAINAFTSKNKSNGKNKGRNADIWKR